MRLVWHADGLLEADWLREMLGDLVDREERDLELNCFDDHSIHVVSSNWRPLPSYAEYARTLRARCERIVLVHLSDEWYSGGYGLYASFDAVIRNFRTALADGDGILTIPEGYSNGTRRDRPIVPVDRRRYTWSFVGELKTSRVEMVRAFDGLSPRRLEGTASISDPGGRKLSKSEYDAILADTVFSPCPMGNAILETWRLYESLELGCIPLVERRLTLDYFGELFGPNPIPAFRSWRSARAWAEAMLVDRQALAGVQHEIASWWDGHKARVRDAVREAVHGPSAAPALRRFAALSRNRHPILHEPLRVGELLRHQSAASLARRLRRPVSPLRRIVREGLR